MKQQIPANEPDIGNIVAFYNRGMLLFGLVIELSARNLIVLLETGESVILNPSRILLKSSNTFPPVSSAIDDFRQSLDNRQIPEFQIPPEGLSFADLTASLKLDSDTGRFSLLLHLKESPQLFYQKHDRYFQRDPEGESKYLQNIQKMQARKNYLQAALDLIRRPSQNHSTSLAVSLIQELRSILQGDKIEDLQKALRREFPEKSISQIRAELGDTLQITDPPLLESGLPIAFIPQPVRELHAPHDVPFNDVKAVSIDDEDSRDFDDAISLRYENGYLLGIHVSNLAQAIEPHCPLFQEARNRISSLYLPSGTVPMLPPQYSEQSFSLRQNEDNAVLSLYARFDTDFRLQEHYLKCETIRIAKNYSYKEVDKEHHQDFWNPFFRIADALREQREINPKTEDRRFIYNLSFTKGRLAFKKIDLHSPSRRMIEELMILYNSVLADYATSHSIPMLFRNINSFFDAEKDWQTNTAFLDTTAGFHPGIGTSAYLHGTSPIRRFVDMVNQMQIYHHRAKGSPLFPEDELKQMIPFIEKRLLLIRETVQRSERYWLMKYIADELMHNPLDGMLRATSNGKYRVEILPWGKQAWLSLDAPPKEEHINFVVYDIDWDKLILKADLID